MAGTLYRAPAPGEPSFVKEGDKVTKGQTICIIEAMKLMNEIEVQDLSAGPSLMSSKSQCLAPGSCLRKPNMHLASCMGHGHCHRLLAGRQGGGSMTCVWPCRLMPQELW